MNSALKSKKILTPDGLTDGIVIISNGIIVEVVTGFSNSGMSVTDYGDLIIMPALTDTHVHINEPGREEWEGFETATKAAAAGGITTLADMPLNSSPVTTDINSLNKKIESSKNKLYVDCGFYGGVIPGNENHLIPMIEEGVVGLKAFMVNSGLDDFPFVNEKDLRNALTKISGFEIPLLVHAETDCGFIKPENYCKYSYKDFLNSRPAQWESEAIKILINLSREFNFHIHIVHLSDAASVDIIKNAKSEGIKITVETCPHYLFFNSEEIKENGTLYKCTPPIRDSTNREKLWQAVEEGVIDFIVSDHSPCTEEFKCTDEGDFEKAWGGISSLQLGLPVIWTECRERGISIERVSELMSRNTSDFLGLGKLKGKIEKNFAADLIVFDPDEKFKVREEDLFYRNKTNPYTGFELFGSVKTVYLKGKKIFEDRKFNSDPEGSVILNSLQNL